MQHILMLLFKDIHYDARVQREAIALAEVGYRVTIACLEEYNFPPEDLHENIIIHRISISSKKIKGSVTGLNNDGGSRSFLKTILFKVIRTPFVKIIKDKWAFNEFRKKVISYLQKEEADINAVHSHDLNTLSAGSEIANHYSAKLIYDSHELFNEMSGRNNLDKIVGYKEEKKLMKKIDHLIVVNPYISELFEKRYGQTPTTIIQNIPLVNLDELSHNVELNYWREKYNLAQDDIILLYQGGINPERGLEECLAAMLLLPERYKFVLLGEGRLKANLIKFVQEKKLDERVFFHEQVPAAKVLWHTKQADIGLVMYRNLSKNNYYSSPNKIFEYLLAGIPTVASNHPGKSYLVDVEKTGVCIEETPDAIKEGIQVIMERYDEYKATCINKRLNFTWDIEQRKLVEMYNKLLKA